MNTARLQRWFCGVSLVLMLLGFTLASSRGGLIGLCVAILYMIVFSGRSRRAAILTTVLLLPMMLLSPASPLSRMLHPGYGDFLGAQVRRDFLRAGLDMVRNHPVTGVGLGNFTAQSFTISREVEGKHGVACNTFLEIAAELGIPGFLAYCAILVGALSSAGKLRAEGKRLNDDFLRYAGQGMQAGLLGFSAGAMFLSAEYQKPFWIIVALTAAVPTLLRQQSGGQNSRQSQLVTSRTTIAATNFLPMTKDGYESTMNGCRSILYFTNSTLWGGAEEHICGLLRKLSRRLFRAHLVCDPTMYERFRVGTPGHIDITPLAFSSPMHVAAAIWIAILLVLEHFLLVHSHLF